MLILRGGPALSASRLDRLRAAVAERVPAVADLDAEHVHLVEARIPPSPTERATLHALLAYGTVEQGEGVAITPKVEPLAPACDGVRLLVVPRLGTISPWSSKATDIARNCGLTSVLRIERGTLYTLDTPALDADARRAVAPLLHDRMTQVVLHDLQQAQRLFRTGRPARLATVPVLDQGEDAVHEANDSLGLALSDDEISYLLGAFTSLARDPTDVELMMFAQANSEHCRHKIFNARWTVDGVLQEHSLFDMIRHTHRTHPGEVITAYADNAAVIRGVPGGRLYPDPETREYGTHPTDLHVLVKVETHNHPTAISPDPGAATGNGGEIRDEGATGRGGKPKAGLVGFSVSDLHLPGAPRPWEVEVGRPDRIASPLEIMLHGPIGGAAYNNEFGRPNLTGYFRTYTQEVPGPDGVEVRGYHKPIMLAGGLGNIEHEHVRKQDAPPGAALVVLGGPAMRIGIGGGAASSKAQGESDADLDFASVQRANPEVERRCQEVIDRCWQMGRRNPILAIHDVGAGGLSNAFPEILHDTARGGRFELRAVPNAERGMSPLEIWCNEAQERYVLTIRAADLPRFERLCKRERAPYAVVGTVTAEQRLVLDDSELKTRAIDLPMPVLFGNPPKMHREVAHRRIDTLPLDLHAVSLEEAARRVLLLPAVADKTFLVTIGDRSITGLVARDPMVGPWQVPVADVAATTASFDTHAGEAFAVGERTPVAILDGPASARMAIGEALTNLVAAPIARLGQVALSCNWMVAAGHPGEDAKLYDTVRTVGLELCPALGICVPVGKDSMSMRTVWEQEGAQRQVVAPLSLVVSAFAPCTDARAVLTPLLRTDGDTTLLLLDLGGDRNRLGASALAQVFGQLGDEPPDLDDPARLVGLWNAIQALNAQGLALAWHDRSDGGLFATLCEMAFASRCGLDVALPGDDPLAALFAEELGGVLQVRTADLDAVHAVLGTHGLAPFVHALGHVTGDGALRFRHGEQVVLQERRVAWHRLWSETTFRMQSLRDDPTCAREEYDRILDEDDPGITPVVPFEVAPGPAPSARRPRVAILREQGVNGQIEMAAAFDRAGFAAVDVHMSDLVQGRTGLDEFTGLVACGGFSYGDVLGAGGGWAKTILHHAELRAAFAAFFAREDAFSLGVCNGCQMLSQLAPLIPGASHWPRFVRNRSEVFEGRVCTVRIEPSPSILLRGMQGARLPIAVAHGEGRAVWPTPQALAAVQDAGLVAMRYVDNRGEPTARYPLNPNGSPGGITALTTTDGRVTVCMPHPERVFRTVTNAWHPEDWGKQGPWMRLFLNAREWVD